MPCLYRKFRKSCCEHFSMSGILLHSCGTESSRGSCPVSFVVITSSMYVTSSAAAADLVFSLYSLRRSADQLLIQMRKWACRVLRPCSSTAYDQVLTSANTPSMSLLHLLLTSQPSKCSMVIARTCSKSYAQRPGYICLIRPHSMSKSANVCKSSVSCSGNLDARFLSPA